MNLDLRLRAIADLVPEGCTLADIGTDHAYLPAKLLQEKKINFAVAADVSWEPCKMAASTLSMAGVLNKSVVRQGNGLDVLSKGECACLVMAGMGAKVMIDILKSGKEIAGAAQCLILQPMLGADRLRHFLCENNFVLVREELVADGKFLYEIIKAQPGMDRVYSKEEYLIGPLLLKNHHPLLLRQFAKQKDTLHKILQGMERSNEAKNSVKFVQTQDLLRKVENLENDYC